MQNDENLAFIRSGATGCVFASVLARQPENINWVRIENPQDASYPDSAMIVSFVFPNKTRDEVIQWALQNGFYTEVVCKESGATGLRHKTPNGISWVQYFGQDSHVKTRQAPHAELLFCVKRGLYTFHKVGFKGVLHLAHACISGLKAHLLDTMWERSFASTAQRLGHSPTILEAAKTTFIHEQ